MPIKKDAKIGEKETAWCNSKRSRADSKHSDGDCQGIEISSWK